MEGKANERPRRISRIIMAVAGFTVLLATVLIFVFVFKPAPVEDSGTAEVSAPETAPAEDSATAQNGAIETAPASGSAAAEVSALEPMLYTKDGLAYMASGGRKVLLEGAKILKNGYGLDVINGEFCASKEWLFYIANYNKTTGEGDLMRVDSRGLNAPELAAQSVCDAKVSSDGQRVVYACGASAGSLYAFDMAWDMPRLIAQGVSWYILSANGNRALYICGDEDTGDLYSWEFAGEPELISGDVCSEYCNGASLDHSFDYNIGFSPNAANIHYIVKTAANSSRDEYTLYVKMGSRKEEKVETRAENSLLSGAMTGNGHLSDNGQMLYFGSSLILLPPLYIFTPGGNIEHFSGESIVLTTFRDGSFLFRLDGSLYYKEPGQSVQKLSEHPFSIPFFVRMFTDLPPYAEKRFLMQESNTDMDKGMPEKVTLFEQQPGKEKIELCELEASPLQLTFDQDIKKLAYVSDGALYFRQKQNGEWSEPAKVSDTGYTELHITENIFDTAGEYMYYRQGESEDAKSGDLYRYVIKRQKSELLMQDVHEFYLIEDIPYATKVDGTLFRADTGEQLVKGAINVTQTEGGVHIFTETDILYYGTDMDKPDTLCDGASLISAGGVMYLPPLTDEIASALEELCDDAQCCIDALKAGAAESFWEYKAKAEELKARRDVSAELDGILNKFSQAFGNAGLWAAYGQSGQEYKVLGDDTTIEDLSNAIKACREYLGTDRDI